MANKKQNRITEHKTTNSRDIAPPPELPQKGTIETTEVASPEVLRLIAKKIQNSLLNEAPTKANLSDYLKLVQLIKETEGDEVREITVRWVDPLWAPDEVEPAA